MRRSRVVLCALVVVLGGILGACGDDEPANRITLEPQQTASSSSPDVKTTKNSEGCKLLSPAERESIAGDRLDAVAPMPAIKGALLCRWAKTLATPRTTYIQVISQPLQVWVKRLPKHIDSLVSSGKADEKYSKELQSLKKDVIRAPEDVSDKQACKYFSLLVEISRDKKGLTEGLLFQGTQYGDYKVTWQRCSRGVHTELIYEEPGLEISLPLAQSVIRLGKIAHKRAAAELE
jgi:hypothetical protein